MNLPAPRLATLLALNAFLTASHAADVFWITPGPGSFVAGENWSDGVPPTAADIGTVGDPDAVVTFANGDAASIHRVNFFQGTFNMTGGTLTINSIGNTSGLLAANGIDVVLNISGGTINTTEGNRGALQALNGGVIHLTGNAVVNAPFDVRTTAGSRINIGDSANDTELSHAVLNSGKISVGGEGIHLTGYGAVNQNAIPVGSNNELWLNDGSITLSDHATWTHSSTAGSSVVSVGRGGTSSLTVQDNAVFTSREGTEVAKVIRLGGDPDSGVATGNGTINILGNGTVQAIGFSKVGGTGTGTINVDGGTIRALGDSTDFFVGFNGTGGEANNSVNIQNGGLKLDTGAFVVVVSGALSGTGALTKQGMGTLALEGASNYSGATIVEAGTLSIGAAGALSDSTQILLQSGTTLELMNAVALNDAIRLTLDSGSAVDLSFVGTETIGILEIDGVVQEIGTYTLAELNGLAGGVTFTGLDDAVLNVTVPEPTTVALLVTAGFGVLVAARRRRQ